jgi:hypothetical protein
VGEERCHPLYPPVFAKKWLQGIENKQIGVENGAKKRQRGKCLDSDSSQAMWLDTERG